MKEEKLIRMSKEIVKQLSHNYGLIIASILLMFLVIVPGYKEAKLGKDDTTPYVFGFIVFSITPLFCLWKNLNLHTRGWKIHKMLKTIDDDFIKSNGL